ncbi:MAG: SDR family oxidoreductase [Deltaproteobacteria bacterium]|nr:SDR family oxidoreductase [Deltaproteobacteria bacterium]
MSARSPLSVPEVMAGRELLVTGVTGFLAKVLVAQLLIDLPQIQRIHVLIRASREHDAEARFLRIAARSPAFRPLRERFGADLGAFLGARIEIHEGDVSEPLFGLGEHTVRMLAPRLDAIIHVAGLTDFAPDPRRALEVNVEGAIHAADLAARCERAVLVHTSTCFVTGLRQGHIPEEVALTTPRGKAWDPEAELAHLQALACHEADSESHSAQREARDVRIGAATARAELLGFTNIYTYTKGLAEGILLSRCKADERRREVSLTIVRPAIIECAERFPFKGWNEGINTTGPLLWLCKSFFRHFPSKDDNHFDLIPVDAVTRSMIAITAAAIAGRSDRVYQIGTSGSNPHTMGRGFELVNLAVRKDMATSEKKRERLVQRFFDNVTVPADVEHAFSPNRLKRLARGLKQTLESVQVGQMLPRGLSRSVGPALDRVKGNAEMFLEGADRQLGRVQRLFDIYRPFIHDNDWVFENGHIRALDKVLDDDSRERFGWVGDAIDWRVYWIDVLYPGLNTWCLPLLEGKEPPDDPAIPLVILPPMVGDEEGVTVLDAGDGDEKSDEERAEDREYLDTTHEIPVGHDADEDEGRDLGEMGA